MVKNANILKVRKYIHDNFSVWFTLYRGSDLCSQTILSKDQTDDVLNKFNGLVSFLFPGVQCFYFDIYHE